MQKKYRTLIQQAEEGGSLNWEEANALVQVDLPELMAAACRVRERFRGDAVSLCAIINAKSGRCGEDCRFCAQSAHHKTGVSTYPLIPEEQILEGADRSAGDGVHLFCIVTSGRRATREDLSKIEAMLRKMRAAGRIRPCASLGTLDLPELKALKEAGLLRYHHNIETARSFYAAVCTTHSFDRRLKTVRNAKAAGLEVCCGGILGMGETMAQRMEMALTLRDLKVDSIPLNFLHPIPGTPLADVQSMGREEILKTVALFRLIHPGVEIRACAGREIQLGKEQGRLLDAGIDGLLTGDYLTTPGTAPEKDRVLVASHGLRVAGGPAAGKGGE
ncbi:MAG: biotin synthase BioB [Deltaproteobacteria bacterium]|nr:biotin synthase BioB [Deltaproteobacteria bacterium]